MSETYDEDSITTEIGSFVFDSMMFAIEIETFPSLDAPHEHSQLNADFHALFDDTLGRDYNEFFGCEGFLFSLEAWIRLKMDLPTLRLGFQESGAQSSDMIALEGLS